MPLLLTVPQAAAELNISKSQFYELLAQGLIRSVYIGTSRRIPADALTEYVAKLETAGSPA